MADCSLQELASHSERGSLASCLIYDVDLYLLAQVHIHALLMGLLNCGGP